MEELLRMSAPPDEDMVDLIEKAFLEGQIDGKRADLAYCGLVAVFRAKVGTFVGTKAN